MKRNLKEGCGNSPLDYKQILELAYWGASCYQDDFIALMNMGKYDIRWAPDEKKIKEYKDGYELCERQMAWLEEELHKYR